MKAGFQWNSTDNSRDEHANFNEATGRWCEPHLPVSKSLISKGKGIGLQCYTTSPFGSRWIFSEEFPSAAHFAHL